LANDAGVRDYGCDVMSKPPTFKGNWVPPYALPKPEKDDMKDELAILLAKEGLEIHRAIDVATHIAGMFGLLEFEAMVKRVQELERQACEVISREWVSLTEQEAAECWSSGSIKTWKNIEAKLKEKNHD